eukprot:TRINITY_DN379_c0_g3_i2.p1 TRINITY_DN379_c0_g3~~TRINITY_DN379_c0_g3_i2.p1  ORF type:complete len:274 (-),score=71.98 TRINITY_DN379_c0_g3_i2:172-993(-)
MEFIRAQRAQEGYDADTQHVLYGLDADLIMLGLATHEMHFTLLREVIFVDRNVSCRHCGRKGHDVWLCPKKKAELKGQPTTEDEMDEDGDVKGKGKEEEQPIAYMKPFQLLKLSVLREYLEFDLSVRNIGFEYDFERVIDDFIFLCFFVGNDFLPHLPSLEIYDGAIDILMGLYKQLLPSLGGYLTNCGDLDIPRTLKFCQELGTIEDEIFVRRRLRDQQQEERKKQREEQKVNREGEGREREIAGGRMRDGVRCLVCVKKSISLNKHDGLRF